MLIFEMVVVGVKLQYLPNQVEAEEAVPYLEAVDEEEPRTAIMDMMEVSAPEAAAEKADQNLETVEKVEMELFGFFDKISQNQFTESQKTPT